MTIRLNELMREHIANVEIQLTHLQRYKNWRDRFNVIAQKDNFVVELIEITDDLNNDIDACNNTIANFVDLAKRKEWPDEDWDG